jgi:hypothetical protein
MAGEGSLTGNIQGERTRGANEGKRAGTLETHTRTRDPVFSDTSGSESRTCAVLLPLWESFWLSCGSCKQVSTVNALSALQCQERA